MAKRDDRLDRNFLEKYPIPPEGSICHNAAWSKKFNDHMTCTREAGYSVQYVDRGYTVGYFFCSHCLLDNLEWDLFDFVYPP